MEGLAIIIDVDLEQKLIKLSLNYYGGWGCRLWMMAISSWRA